MIREIKITPVLNGFVCKLGCQTVVFGSAHDLAENIERYYKNPDVVEKEFIAKAVNKMNPMVCVSEACDVAPIRSETFNSVDETRSLSPLRETRR